jgi:hypothetical protein
MFSTRSPSQSSLTQSVVQLTERLISLTPWSALVSRKEARTGKKRTKDRNNLPLIPAYHSIWVWSPLMFGIFVAWLVARETAVAPWFPLPTVLSTFPVLSAGDTVAPSQDTQVTTNIGQNSCYKFWPCRREDSWRSGSLHSHFVYLSNRSLHRSQLLHRMGWGYRRLNSKLPTYSEEPYCHHEPSLER